jgi:hypothetical protein
MPVFRQASDAAAGDVKLECITQPLYDEADIVTGASNTVFFQNITGRSYLFTNMESAGSLTWPKRYSVKAFRLIPDPYGIAVDIASFHANGHFVFRVGEKNYLIVPNFLLTPGIGLEAGLITGAAVPAAPANSVALLHNGRPEHRNIFILQHSIWLPSVQNFRATIEMAATHVSTATLQVWVMLEGEQFREIQ